MISFYLTGSDKRYIENEVFRALKIFRASQFAKELKKNHILEMIVVKKKAEQVTIFAPSKFRPSNVMDNKMMKDSGQREHILMNHFVNGIMTLEELKKKREFYTLGGKDKVRITCFGGVSKTSY